jgi:serine/threonine-protein kinase
MSLGTLGNYELLALLGKGGTAEVFRAKALSGERAGHEFALKRLLPERRKDQAAMTAFGREANLARWLDHPNIVKVHEVDIDGDSLFLVMDLVDGRDLGQLIKRCRSRNIAFPIDFAVYLTRALLLALDYAHQAKGPNGEPLHLVHCDVSPSNLFISRTGDLKLGDFGVARAPGDAYVLGKPYYLSPEALHGTIGPALDLWSSTVMLYELLTLNRPFIGKTPEEVFAAIEAQQYVPLRAEVPERVAAVVAKGFAVDPAARFPDAKSYADALEGLYDERVGTPLAISAMVRGLFGVSDELR